MDFSSIGQHLRPKPTALRKTLALHFIHQFAVNSTWVCPLWPCAWPPVVNRAESSMTAFVAWRGPRPLPLAGLGCLAVAFAAVTRPEVAFAADPVAESTLR